MVKLRVSLNESLATTSEREFRYTIVHFNVMTTLRELSFVQSYSHVKRTSDNYNVPEQLIRRSATQEE